MSGNPLIVATSKDSSPDVAFCDGCGEERKRVELSKCKGCESACIARRLLYNCAHIKKLTDRLQECQKKGWKEGGHKDDCRILKAVSALDLGDRGW
jgi:hypothetical protein